MLLLHSQGRFLSLALILEPEVHFFGSDFSVMVFFFGSEFRAEAFLSLAQVSDPGYVSFSGCGFQGQNVSLALLSESGLFLRFWAQG